MYAYYQPLNEANTRYLECASSHNQGKHTRNGYISTRVKHHKKLSPLPLPSAHPRLFSSLKPRTEYQIKSHHHLEAAGECVCVANVC